MPGSWQEKADWRSEWADLVRSAGAYARAMAGKKRTGGPNELI